MVAALVLGSCAPAAGPEPTPTPKEGPQYGGKLTWCLNVPIVCLDEALNSSPPANCRGTHYVNEHLTGPDWKKANFSTGNYGWRMGDFCPMELRAGWLVESWEFPDNTTIIYHVRKGVHWHNKPPTNGREFTAEDIAFNIERMWTVPTAYHGRAYKGIKPVSVKALDKYTVEVKTIPPEEDPSAQALIWELTSGMMSYYPKDAVEYYGDLGKWENTIGTGPWMIVDYTPSHSISYERNPNYWQKDPFYPENQLPYPDKMTILIIVDKSTRLAALRTAKLDITAMTDITWEDHDLLAKSNPELMERKLLHNFPNHIYMKLPGTPFEDIRVRRALMLSINRETIVQDYFGGNAESFSAPLQPTVGHAGFFTPLAELPPEVQELWQYKPGKAKQLLTEAGYPNGFKFKVNCYQAQADELSILKAYFEDIGVEMELDIKEYSSYVASTSKHTFEHAVYGTQGTGAATWKVLYWKYPTVLNRAEVKDDIVNEGYRNAYTWEYYKDTTKRNQVYKETYQHIYELVWTIPFPVPYVYTMWWPWVKGYHGEKMSYGAHFNWTAYPWVDQELKKTMGH